MSRAPYPDAGACAHQNVRRRGLIENADDAKALKV